MRQYKWLASACTVALLAAAPAFAQTKSTMAPGGAPTTAESASTGGVKGDGTSGSSLGGGSTSSNPLPGTATSSTEMTHAQRHATGSTMHHATSSSAADNSADDWNARSLRAAQANRDYTGTMANSGATPLTGADGSSAGGKM